MALWSRLKIWVSKENLTASDQNSEFNNVITNSIANKVVGSSADVAAMQVTVDPGEVGTENLASSVEGEVRGLRNLIKQITAKTEWYETPIRDLTDTVFHNAITSSSTDTDVTGKDILIVDTSGGDISLQGLQGGVNNQILYVIKIDTNNSLDIIHNGSGTQKIVTNTGVDLNIPAALTGAIPLHFNGTRWQIIKTELQSNEVTAGTIATDAVTTVKIKDLNVTAAKLAAGVIPELKIVKFTSGGNFTVPAGVDNVFIFGAGAGGGGGGGSGGGAAAKSGAGGSGGNGALPLLFPLEVFPGAPASFGISITIGTGGAGGGGGAFTVSGTAGSAGNTTTVVANGVGQTLKFPGGKGGNPGTISAGTVGVKGDAIVTQLAVSGSVFIGSGDGGDGATSGAGNVGIVGERSISQNGGTAGLAGSAGPGVGGSGGGGGGAGGTSTGGSGGTGGTGSGSGLNGGSPSGSAGGGGGGGAGDSSGAGPVGGNGGTGAGGFVWIFYTD